jgi:hypothetical protein
MHFVRPAYGPDIRIVAPAKPFKPLMNDHIMYNKIREPICHDAEPGRLNPPDMVESSVPDQQYAWHSENNKEQIVLFEETGLGAVMILMQVPKKSMHHKFMGAPGEALHYNECRH